MCEETRLAGAYSSNANHLELRLEQFLPAQVKSTAAAITNASLAAGEVQLAVRWWREPFQIARLHRQPPLAVGAQDAHVTRHYVVDVAVEFLEDVQLEEVLVGGMLTQRSLHSQRSDVPLEMQLQEKEGLFKIILALWEWEGKGEWR